MSRRVAQVASALGLLLCVAVVTATAGDDLTKAQRKARDAYLAVLQATAINDPIVDSNDVAIQERLVQAVDLDPVRPSEFDPRLTGTVLVAYVVERDGTVSHPSAVWYEGAPALRNAAMAAVGRMKYEKAALLDGQPVRAYTLTRFRFRGGT